MDSGSQRPWVLKFVETNDVSAFMNYDLLLITKPFDFHLFSSSIHTFFFIRCNDSNDKLIFDSGVFFFFWCVWFTFFSSLLLAHNPEIRPKSTDSIYRFPFICMIVIKLILGCRDHVMWCSVRRVSLCCTARHKLLTPVCLQPNLPEREPRGVTQRIRWYVKNKSDYSIPCLLICWFNWFGYYLGSEFNGCTSS